MKVIDFVEHLQKHNPSKPIVFALYADEKHFDNKTEATMPSILFEIIGEKFYNICGDDDDDGNT
jgi:hypothetical protein